MTTKTLYYILFKEYQEIVFKCFDKEETLKYIEEERLSPKYYQMNEVQVNLEEFFKIRGTEMQKYLNKIIKKGNND